MNRTAKTLLIAFVIFGSLAVGALIQANRTIASRTAEITKLRAENMALKSRNQYDINNDGIVNLKDYSLFSDHFGK